MNPHTPPHDASRPAGPRELPSPDAEAQAHSARLGAHIREALEAAGGRLDFARFMELALYAPGLGYYSAGARKFGEAGDFVTAPELSPLFSRCVARQCAQVLAEAGGEILEFGAGSGVMAADILAELERLGRLPAHYYILELSAELRQRQARTLEARVPGLAERVVWLEQLPDSFSGVVLANEVLDAMPVHRFRLTPTGAEELYVQWSGEGFAWQAGPPAEPRLAERVQALAQAFGLGPGYESEINLRAEDWVRGLGQWLERGLVLLFDYGFPRHEYYHPQRSGGTLMCHYRHRAHADPLILPGLQDITAHVDFTAMAEAALAGGMEVRGFTNQANFLLATGLTELAAEAGGEARTQLEVAAQVKRLTLPGEMGELFKVLALGRGLEQPLVGFALRDERGRL